MVLSVVKYRLRNIANCVLQTFLSKRHLKRDLAKDIVEVFYEKVNSQQDTERVFDSLSSSLKVRSRTMQLTFFLAGTCIDASGSTFFATYNATIDQQPLKTEQARTRNHPLSLTLGKL